MKFSAHRFLLGTVLSGQFLFGALFYCPVQVQASIAGWGGITAPVYGQKEKGIYSEAELFAGPNKFGGYYTGVLPNGRIVKPAGVVVQCGMNSLGSVLTPDGKYLITSNNDERNDGEASLTNPPNMGGYSLTVIHTSSMKVISQINTAGRFFIGLQCTGSGPYTLWASGGGDNNIKLFSLDNAGKISGPEKKIEIKPLLPSDAGYVSNYKPDAAFKKPDANGDLPPVPTGFERDGAKITFPAGSSLSPDGSILYVACNGDNSLAIINTKTYTVAGRVAVGYFPYGVTVSKNGQRVIVSNWGITEYKFKNPVYDPVTHKLLSITPAPENQPDGFYVPKTSTDGQFPKTSSVSLLTVNQGTPDTANLDKSIHLGLKINLTDPVGDSHPCATAIVRSADEEVLYVARANSDSLSLISLKSNKRLPEMDLSPIQQLLAQSLKGANKHLVHGSYPNALAVSPDNKRLYVAEAGLNSVAVIDVSKPLKPRLLGRIPTGWYPAALSMSPDGKTLYVVNAKGIGEDLNPLFKDNPSATGVESFSDSNFVFGSVQKIDLTTHRLNNVDVIAYNYSVHKVSNTEVVPIGGTPSRKIKHVFFILHENKSFDSMLGSRSDHFGPYSSVTFNNRNGAPFINRQNAGVCPNIQTLAVKFATAVNYYSDSEESDAGHDYCASGTATDYTEKTLLVKYGRGLLVNKNMDPEDYPEGGYIFNNAARNGVSFKDYGDMIRITGTDTGSNTPTIMNDPTSGKLGYPLLKKGLEPRINDVTDPLENAGDTSSPTQGMGQSYFMAIPDLAILGTNNPNGEPRLDRNYPGYNFNISDQRRALEYIADFNRMLKAGTVPTLSHIYLPNNHTGGAQAPNRKEVGTSPFQQIADSDVGLGMVVQRIINSPLYYNPETGEGSAIFITFDDAQASLDHIHQHRTPLIVISPYAKPGYLAKQHYSSASIVKTEELLMGLPPNNLGDLFATDLRDMFQATYNGIKPESLKFTRKVTYAPSPEGQKIWALVDKLDTSAPDLDSLRLGRLNRLSGTADDLHNYAASKQLLSRASYKKVQSRLYQLAKELVMGAAPRDMDD